MSAAERVAALAEAHLRPIRVGQQVSWPGPGYATTVRREGRIVDADAGFLVVAVRSWYGHDVTILKRPNDLTYHA